MTIDMHVHVGLVGDKWSQWGAMSAWYRSQINYKVFLYFARISAQQASDQLFHDTSLKTISESKLDKVVCLALDPAYDRDGNRRPDQSHMWVSNDYVLELAQQLPGRILLGASVHPYDPQFKQRVAHYVDQGAVLLKWLPSAQRIDLANPCVKAALEFLATAKGGKPLPLLLHVGPEYAILPTDHRTASYDYFTWNFSDWLDNLVHRRRLCRPDERGIERNLRAGLDAGAQIIFAHCGSPYFTAGLFDKILEHSELDTVTKYVREYTNAFVDVSAFCTPFRRAYFEHVKQLPPAQVLYGSDFPTPALELSADLQENLRDFGRMLKGDLSTIVVPQGNLLDVNLRELKIAFGEHPMFTNFNGLVS